MTKQERLRVELEVMADLGNDYEEKIAHSLLTLLDLIEDKQIGFKNEKEK